jgi:hypothetical protein
MYKSSFSLHAVEENSHLANSLAAQFYYIHSESSVEEETFAMFSITALVL